MAYRELNNETINLIKSFEGWRANAYKDAVGIWTIGYGHTAMAGPPAPKSGMSITREEGENLLRKDLRKYQKAVDSMINVPLNDNQYGALVSFTYNVGPGNLRTSTLRKKLNRGDYEGAVSEFRKWVKAGGKTLRGLQRRRKAERILFLKTD